MADPRGMTLTEKIISLATGRERVTPGEIVTCTVGLALMHDSGGPRRVAEKLRQINAKVWDPSKVVLVTDHFVPAIDIDSANILVTTRNWAAEHGIKNFHDMQGISHVILPEKGLLLPGLFAVGGDSHSPTAGAYGTFMIGIGATEMVSVLATGEIWIKVPSTTLIRCEGKLQNGVVAKDMVLHLCATIGMDNSYQVIEYSGSTINDLSMQERMVLTNMTAELGAKTGIIAPDQNTLTNIQHAGGKIDEAAIKRWQADENAYYDRIVDIDVSQLEPQIAAPHSPENTLSVSHHKGVKVNQAYIGACTGAKETDLKMAAEILKGRKVAQGTRLLIAPASIQTTKNCIADGTMATLTEAGAIILPTGCGACAGMGAGIIGKGETCIASIARNFKGRMGDPDSNVYLGSPYSVAAAAVFGEVTDPRELLAE
jgi:3-isopropylmalate/(R)-2-methylmalate dehydratase large subunit